MKTYEKIQDLEKKIFRSREQSAFLTHQLDSLDRAIEYKKQKLEADITAYNERIKADQKVLSMHDKNIELWTKKLNDIVKVEIKQIEKEKEISDEKIKSPKQIAKEALLAKKKVLEEELKKLKEKPPISEPKIVEKEEIDFDNAPEGVDYVQLKDVIEDRNLASKELREFADDLNGETKQIEWLQEHHEDWIQAYSDEEGGNAIWRGSITKSFRRWCEEKGYIIAF